MECLVCDGTTKGLHHGMEVCRACVVFYRRMQKRAPASCRTKGKCQGKNTSCRRCRYDRFNRLLLSAMGNGKLPSLETSSLRAPTDRPLLSAISEAYRDLCHFRIRMENEAFAHLPSSSLPLLPTTFVEVTKQDLRLGNHFVFFHGWSIGDYATFAFVESCFTRLPTYTADVKVAIVRAFFPLLGFLDFLYRGELYFPGDDKTDFCSFTTINTVGRENFPGFTGNQKEDADNILHQCRQMMIRCKKGYRKMQLNDDVEFATVLGLMLLDIASMNLKESLLPAIEHYRQQLLRDLQSYYRELNTECDYASRIGSLVGVTLAIRGYVASLQELLLMYYVAGVIRPGSDDYKFIS